MKYSKLFIQTFKEIPNDAQLVSHQLLHRGGYILKSGAGLYSYSPLMQRVVAKVKQIIGYELGQVNCIEISMPFSTPAELWQESKRWDELGHLMVKFQDRMNRYLCLSPTNEEAVVDYFRKIAKSYKQLPVCLFQINTKFRDEIRPRFGLMRAREFMMKDAYSFHMNQRCLDNTYDQLYTAYNNIFKTMGLDCIAVQADGGAMADSGAKTHEFQALATSGEDQLVVCRKENKAMNSEMAITQRAAYKTDMSTKASEEVLTPKIKTIQAVCEFLHIELTQSIKTLLLKGQRDNKQVFILACCLGDDDINLTKCSAVTQVINLENAQPEDFKQLNLFAGFLGPINCSTQIAEIIFDSSIDPAAAYVMGANKKDIHYKNVVLTRDIKQLQRHDIRMAKPTDVSLNGNPIEFIKGIEVGHIFQLGSKYTQALKAAVLDENGKAVYPLMGCYGIGVGRAIAAVVEQSHDQKGIIWPQSIAPFSVIILPLVLKDNDCKDSIDQFYQDCLANNIDVLLDDRNVSVGIKFKDADLIGIPHQVIFGKTFKENKNVEYVHRSTGDKRNIPFNELLGFLKKEIKG